MDKFNNADTWEKKTITELNSQNKGKGTSPGSATITNLSPSETPEEKETDKTKQALIEQMYENH